MWKISLSPLNRAHGLRVCFGMTTESRSEPIPRRAVLMGGLAALTVPAMATAQPRTLSFEVRRNGRKIGEQSITFDDRDGLSATTQTDLAVALGPVTLYRYRHEASELWRDGRFVNLETRTNDNGKMLRVTARRESAGVRIVQASGAVVQAPEAVLPFTHWNRLIAVSALFNPQDGKLLKERASPGRSSSVSLADGSTRRAEGVVFQGDIYIEDWYDQDGVWTALDGRLKDGSNLAYRRL